MSGAPLASRPHIDTEALKQRHPIEDVLARVCGIELRPAGSHALRGRCPFHPDQGLCSLAWSGPER